MTKMEKLLDNVVDVSECCIIFSAAKNAEGELEGSVQLKTPKESKYSDTFLKGAFTMLSAFNKILLEQKIDFRGFGKNIFSVFTDSRFICYRMCKCRGYYC